MNKTEVAAYDWLREQGYKEIICQGRDSPDFITENGSFEVKRPIGNVLMFTKGQIEKIKAAKAKVLVFKDKVKSPVATLEADELVEGQVKMFILKVESLEIIKATLRTKELLESLKVHPNQGFDEVVMRAASIMRTVREMRPMLLTALDTEGKLSKLQKEQIQALLDMAWFSPPSQQAESAF